MLLATYVINIYEKYIGSDSYGLSRVIIEYYDRSADVDQQRLPADDSAVEAVDVLGCHTEHHISTALWTRGNIITENTKTPDTKPNMMCLYL